MLNGASALKNSSAVCYKPKHALSIPFYDFHSNYISIRLVLEYSYQLYPYVMVGI
jgi:hypothetical protein